MQPEFSFGQWIRRRRGALGLTREVLAERVAYSVAMLRKIENDERTPSPKAAALLAQALEVPPDQVDEFLKVARRERAVDRLGAPLQDKPLPWEALGRPRSNLPVPPTLLVGREGELARVTELIEDPACRLVSLVGLGGVGKSRLALQAAQGQLERFPHGVYFVPLARLTDPASIAPVIAETLHVQFHEAAEPQAELLHFLRDKRILLVLDNVEHLVEGTGLLAAMLQAAPGLKLLVTSRERLNLRGEWVLELSGLPYPAALEGEALEDLEAYAAVQLFLQSALRADPGFSLNEDNREAVARICQLTEGLPLAIELAATWVRALPCKTVAQEIETNLNFLKTSARDLPERQRSVRATLDHSWRLLPVEERESLRRLSVFRGGFSLVAAQAVAEAGLDVVTALLSKSLLKRVGDDRYDMHELVRHYAGERLTADPHAQAETRARHSRYFAEQCERWGNVVTSLAQREILTEMGMELENVRLAWDWLLDHQETALLRRALRGLWYFHEMQGRYHAGADFMARAVAGLQAPIERRAGSGGERSIVLGQVMARLAYFQGHVGAYEAARTLFDQSLALLRASGDQAALADALAYYGHMYLRQGNLAEASRYLETGLSLHRALGNTVGQVFCLITLSFTALSQQDFEKAYRLSGESLTLCREKIHNPYGASNSLIALSSAAYALGRLVEAQGWAEESLALSRRLNNRWGIGQALRQLGSISLRLGESERAEALFRQSAAEFNDIGDRPFTARALADLGRALHASGAYADAQQCFLDALQTAMHTQTNDLAQQVLVELAVTQMTRGSHELALELALRCLQHPATSREVKDRAQRLHNELVAQLDPQQVESVQVRVEARSLDSVVQEVLATV